ncbi:hypothetical protein GZH47_31570 (plasmid) [Paenibacillus rhizovicinus]|uniref:Transposase n=1 Tax=Paenibacillus rhizovicinus TaxID=2704463 RepID=A0A6C0P9Z7_9BACL|nr:hypothetical protein [Paenibacillus rhizovicinus]QHW35440.1 hypothetical protein GZH47_31570 [Paenibacillus rhizovicinus]
MIHTMKLELLTSGTQHETLIEVMTRFNQACNHISEIGFRTKTHRSKIRLFKQCYYDLRENYSMPSQMVVRAVGKVVDAYKSGFNAVMKFGEYTSVVYDSRSLTFKWMNHVSISTFEERIEVPFRVVEYRQGTFDRLGSGLADLILQDNKFYLLLLVNLPVESDSDGAKVLTGNGNPIVSY